MIGEPHNDPVSATVAIAAIARPGSTPELREAVLMIGNGYAIPGEAAQQTPTMASVSIGRSRLSANPSSGKITHDRMVSRIVRLRRAKATPIVKERLRYFSLFSIREVYAAVAREAGLPARPSRQIEDLGDLMAFDNE
jgi:hypothetical protein